MILCPLFQVLVQAARMPTKKCLDAQSGTLLGFILCDAVLYVTGFLPEFSSCYSSSAGAVPALNFQGRPPSVLVVTLSSLHFQMVGISSLTPTPCTLDFQRSIFLSLEIYCMPTLKSTIATL